MRILIVSNTPFLPTTAGNRARIAQMVTHLRAEGAEIAVLLLTDADRATWDEAGMRAQVAHCEIVAPSFSARLTDRVERIRTGAAPDPATPYGIDDWCPPWFRRRVAAFARAWQPTVVIAEYVFLSMCLDDLRQVVPHALRIIDTHDVMHRRQSVYDAAGLTPRWFHTTSTEERRGLLRADTVLAIHADEAAILRQLVPERRVLTVPHGHPVALPRWEMAAPDRAVFIASHNALNREGWERFVGGVWPLVRAAAPRLRIDVHGSIATELHGVAEGIALHGPAVSLSEIYARARVVVNPIPSATGLQIKTVEALCHARPMVSTPAGAGGLSEDAGVLVAHSAAEFAAALVRLVDDDVAWRRVAGAAHDYALTHFAPAVAFAELLRHLRTHDAATPTP